MAGRRTRGRVTAGGDQAMPGPSVRRVGALGGHRAHAGYPGQPVVHVRRKCLPYDNF
jgi:hypothetical protein